MQDITLNFDASNVAPQRALDPFPSGWYMAAITDAEMVPSANKPQNQMLALELTVLEGPHAGRKLYDRLNLVNDNPTAVEIAYSTLSAIQHAVGLIRCGKVSELANRPMKVKVKLVPPETKVDQQTGATKTYDAKNEVKGYDAPNSAHELASASVTAGGVAGAPAGTPPWAAAGAPGAVPQPFAAGGPVAAPAAPSAPAPAAGGWTPPAGAAQPWAAPGAAAPQPFAPPAAPAPPAPVDALASAQGDGWVAHPQSAGWFYRGQEVLSEADLRARYSAPAAPVAAPFTPPAIPGAPQPAAAAGPTPPWAR